MEARRDVLRILAIFGTVISASTLSIYGVNLITGNGLGSSISGASVVKAGNLSAGSIIIPIGALILLIISIIIIAKLNAAK